MSASRGGPEGATTVPHFLRLATSSGAPRQAQLEKHPDFKKVPCFFANRLANRPFSGLVCLGGLQFIFFCPSSRDFPQALETTTAVKRRQISCALGVIVEFLSHRFTVIACRGRYRSAFHGCWLVVWRLLRVQRLPLSDGQVEKSSFHGRSRFGSWEVELGHTSL